MLAFRRVCWTKFWAIRALSIRVRLRKLQAESLAHAAGDHRHRRRIRMARSMIHGKHTAEETWLEWHRRTSPAAREELTAAWGANHVTSPAASAASGTGRMVARPACSVVERAMRWRSAADVYALRFLAGVSSRLLEPKPRRPAPQEVGGYNDPGGRLGLAVRH